MNTLKRFTTFFHFSPINKNGIALFLVLWVLTLLTVIVGEFCHTMRTEVNITRNFKEETQAYYIAVAGVNTAIAELIRNEVIPKKDKLEEEETEEEQIEWRVNADIPEIPFANGIFKIKIGNESGKINLNKASHRLLHTMLSQFELEEIDENIIVDSILDWRDSDHLHRLNGAEDDYYQGLSEPYECKDDDFDSIEELLLVKGITPEIYEKLKDSITVYQEETTKKSKKTGKKKKAFDFDKININAASSEMLLILPEMTDELVQEIMAFREENDFKSLGELIPIVGSDIYTAIAPYLSLKTLPVFSINSVGMIDGSQTKHEIQALVRIDTKLKKKYRIIKWIDSK